MQEREREREQKAGPWALIVDGKLLHAFDEEPPEWVRRLTVLKGIRLEPVEEKGDGEHG